MENNMFKAVLFFLFWKNIKEHPKNIKSTDKVISEIYKKVIRHRNLMKIVDKEKIYLEMNNEIITRNFCEKGLSDNDALNYLEPLLIDNTKDELFQFFKIASDYILDDKIVSFHEKEILYMLGNKLKISEDEIDNLLENSKTNKTIDVIITDQNINSKRNIYYSISGIFVGLFIIIFTGIGFYRYHNAENAFASFNYSKVIEQNPLLVFKKIDFNKYIVFGKPEGTYSHFDKLYIYSISGTADIQFNLKKLAIKQVDYISKTIELAIDNELPIEIDVKVPQDKIYKIEEISPTPISNDEAKDVSKAVAVPAGILGAYVGTKIGADIGGTIFKLPFIGRLGGGAIGGALAAAGLSSGAYIMTSKFLTGLKLDRNTLGEQDLLLNTAKPLIALELMGGNLLASDNWDAEIKKYYQNAFEAKINELLTKYGWEHILIKYT